MSKKTIYILIGATVAIIGLLIILSKSGVIGNKDKGKSVEITKKDIDTTIIVLIPATKNKPDVVNFVIDGLFLNNFIIKKVSIEKDNGVVRFFPAAAIKNMVSF